MRKFFVLTVLFFLAMLASNPTTIVVTAIALVFSVIVAFVPIFGDSGRRQRKFGLRFILLVGVITLTWLGWAAPVTLDYVVGNGWLALEGFEKISGLGGLALGTLPFCGLNYCTVLLFERDFLAVYGVFAVVCILALLLSRNSSRQVRSLLVTWFVGTLAFLSLAVHFDNTYLIRSFLYGLFPISAAVGIVLGRRGRRVDRRVLRRFFSVVKVFALVLLVSAPGLLTVCRYGVDAFQYVPSSGLYAADFAAAESRGRVLIFEPIAPEFRFYKALYGGTMELGVTASGSTYYSAVGSIDGRSAFKSNASASYVGGFDSIIFVDYASNFYLLHEGAPQLVALQNGTERLISARCNRVFADSTVRIYQATASFEEMNGLS
jgi:hypothetical protein